jgi:catechol 2,3-dioxygenase-like lactoylglutathione lyase family enzyme
MSENVLGTMQVCQIGLVVHDIERSIDAYCRVFGIARPQVIITDDYEQAKTAYRGQPSRAKARLAFIDMGQVQLELIEPIGEPSTWKEALDANGESVHHIAFIIKGTDQVVQKLGDLGMPIAQQGYYTGGMYTYIDSAQSLGVVLELLENFEK